MTKTEFFQKHGHILHKVANDCTGYGDFLIPHPEGIDIAKELQEKGYTIVSVYETEDEEDFVDMSEHCDFGKNPYKYGYFAILNNYSYSKL